MSIFTPEELISLSTQIEQQRRELESVCGNLSEQKTMETLGLIYAYEELPEAQSQVIAEVTNEEPESFLKRFAKAAGKDLCDSNGLLNQQWKKWRDLTNKDVLEKFGNVLVLMGFTAQPLNTLVVALSVIVLHVGVTTFCEKYSGEGGVGKVGEVGEAEGVGEDGRK